MRRLVKCSIKKEENCRKLFSRAKQKIAKVEGESLHYQKNKFVVDCFIQAFQKQQTDTLIELISENVTLYSDDGGKVKGSTSSHHLHSLLFGFLQRYHQEIYR